MRALWVVSLLLCSSLAAAEPLTIYSGRNQKLIGSVFKDFEKETGIKVRVRYGETPALAATLLEEGDRSPADVYVAQDAGALGALAKANRLAKLPDQILNKVVDPRFKSPAGVWVGISGRARVLAYNTEKVKPDALPSKVAELTDPKWKGRIGWAPTNASFQSFVTTMRLMEGEEKTAEWLRKMKANEPRRYKNNMAIIEALGRGEIDVGLTNHYYLHAAQKARKSALPIANHYFEKGDPGALINVAGVAVLKTSKNIEAAHKLLDYLLSPKAQKYFADRTNEYPLIEGVKSDAGLKPITEVGSPSLDLTKLDDLQGTVRLLQREGVL